MHHKLFGGRAPRTRWGSLQCLQPLPGLRGAPGKGEKEEEEGEGWCREDWEGKGGRRRRVDGKGEGGKV